ncbi:MAG: hypothetical protein M1423_02735 [Acidobacteria bacterium]|nr:hypothetical protein [Acidobacteriota bacterium]
MKATKAIIAGTMYFTVHVAGGVCRTAEGSLAGSTVTLDAALRYRLRPAGAVVSGKTLWINF